MKQAIETLLNTGNKPLIVFTRKDLLGEEVFYRMLHYQQVIKRDFNLGSLMTQGVSELRQKDESSTSFYTVVRLDWAYVYRWMVIPESPVVKRVAFEYKET